jgi:hypothetical protein
MGSSKTSRVGIKKRKNKKGVAAVAQHGREAFKRAQARLEEEAVAAKLCGEVHCGVGYTPGRDMRLSPEVLATLKQVVPCLTARVNYAQLQSRLTQVALSPYSHPAPRTAH